MINTMNLPGNPEQSAALMEAIESIQRFQEWMAKAMLEDPSLLNFISINEKVQTAIQSHIEEYRHLMALPSNLSIVGHIREIDTLRPEFNEHLLELLRPEGLDPDRRRIGFFPDRD